MGNVIGGFLDNTTVDISLCGYHCECRDQNTQPHAVDLVIKVEQSNSTPRSETSD